MVQGTIEFCRVAWDIEQSKKNIVSLKTQEKKVHVPTPFFVD